MSTIPVPRTAGAISNILAASMRSNREVILDAIRARSQASNPVLPLIEIGW
jgi:hypothetical protein